MPAPLLTVGSAVLCPHGGRVLLTPTAARVLLSGQPAVGLPGDAPVTGCPLQPAPCIRVQFTTGTTRVLANGTPVLNLDSIGTCFAANGTPTGTAVVTSPDPRVQGT